MLGRMTLGSRMRLAPPLISVLCSVAITLAALAGLASAATVGCGRVTTFVGPNATGSLPSGDGWVIFAKADGTSEKVILRSGTPVPTLSGYICIASEGVYSTGVIPPGAPGYIPEPADFVTGTGLYCGTVATNPFTSGQISGPRTLQLTGPLNAFGLGVFRVPASIELPAIRSYFCGRFEVGAPSVLVTVLRAGDPGYIASLPNTSTSSDGSAVALVVAFALLVVVTLTLVGLRRARQPAKISFGA